MFFFALVFLVGAGMIGPSLAISNAQWYQAMALQNQLGADGGLTSQTAPCTIAAVFHRPVVTRQLAHQHHPHSPKRRQLVAIVQKKMIVSPDHSKRQLLAGDEAVEVPATAPVGPAPHPHIVPPASKVSYEYDDGSKYVGELDDATGHFHGRGEFTSPEGDRFVGDFKDGEYQCDKCLVQRRGLAHRAQHWREDCYDRFAFAFAPGSATSTSGAVGETLQTLSNRMATSGFVLQASDVPSPPASTDVVLSAPLNIPRVCDFPFGETSAPTDRDPILQDGTMRIGPFRGFYYNAPYVAPAADISRECGASGSLRGYFTNAAQATWLDDNVDDNGPFDPSRYTQWEQDDLPAPLWSFAPQAPTAYELAVVGTDYMITTKVNMTPPDLLPGTAGACEPPFGLTSDFSAGCHTRDEPSEWSSSCPLRVGASLPCWWIDASLSTADDELAKRVHGCATARTTTGSAHESQEPASEELAHQTAQMRAMVPGTDAPPNPYCMTILPPSWRVAEWTVLEKLKTVQGFNPQAMMWASIIMMPVGLVCCIGSCCWMDNSQKRLKRLMAEQTANSQVGA